MDSLPLVYDTITHVLFSGVTLVAQLVGSSNSLVIGILANPYYHLISFLYYYLKPNYSLLRTCQGFLIFKFFWYYTISITCITDLEFFTLMEYTERWCNLSYR